VLDLNEVAVFVEVVRAGSFAAAGRRLGIPSNTVSRQVQQLESRLGSRLLHRSTRKLSLTDAGRRFFERCAGSVSELVQAGQDIIDGGRVPGGLIRVAAPAGFLDAFGIDWIAEFLEAYPQVQLQFALSDAKADLVAEGIDVAFRAGEPFDPGSVSRLLLSQSFILVASPAYLKRRSVPKRVEELAHHDCLLYSNTPGPVIWRMDGAKEVRVSGRFTANTSRAVLNAALLGLGIAMLPEVVAAPDLRARRLTRVLPKLHRSAGDLHAVFPSRQQIPRAVSAFVEYAARRVRSLESSIRGTG
jgi:DNA-binding transcriptional LysR family regulator